MKFRIVEIKQPHMKPKFKPQFKNSGWFSSWINIAETGFAKTIFCTVTFSDWDTNSVYSKSNAEQVIKEFKEYLIEKETYTIIHNIS